MKNKKMKKLQRKVNHIIRALNENIRNDDLWQGRFQVKQLSAHMYEYEDKSGINGTWHIKMVDLNTGREFHHYADCFDLIHWHHGGIGYHLWEWINKFIVDTCDVWNETPSPRERELFCYDYAPDRRWSK